MDKSNLKNILTAVRDIINRSFANAIRKAQSAEKQARNARLAANASQTTANNARAAANAAQTAADRAQSAANAAQETADVAQATSDKVQTSIDDSFILVQQEFIFDKKTVGRDSFRFNAFSYYKISEFAPSKESVVSFVGTRETGDILSNIIHGTGCDHYGMFIVVTSTSNPTLPPTNDSPPMSISPPSTGLYALYEAGNTFTTAGTAKFTLTSKQAIVLMSSTQGSVKKFKITVDDTGTISATEVTQ